MRDEQNKPRQSPRITRYPHATPNTQRILAMKADLATMQSRYDLAREGDPFRMTGPAILRQMRMQIERAEAEL